MVTTAPLILSSAGSSTVPTTGIVVWFVKELLRGDVTVIFGGVVSRSTETGADTRADIAGLILAQSR